MSSATVLTAAHMERAAYVYVRQSSEFQVQNNVERQHLQYALAEHAREGVRLQAANHARRIKEGRPKPPPSNAIDGNRRQNLIATLVPKKEASLSSSLSLVISASSDQLTPGPSDRENVATVPVWSTVASSESAM